MPLGRVRYWAVTWSHDCTSGILVSVRESTGPLPHLCLQSSNKNHVEHHTEYFYNGAVRLPHPGPHRWGTPVWAGPLPPGSGRWRSTSRCWHRKRHGGAPTSPACWCSYTGRPARSGAPSCKLQSVTNDRCRQTRSRGGTFAHNLIHTVRKYQSTPEIF